MKPLVALICGSGLGSIANLVENKYILPYENIPDFPRSTGKRILMENLILLLKLLIYIEKSKFIELINYKEITIEKKYKFR